MFLSLFTHSRSEVSPKNTPPQRGVPMTPPAAQHQDRSGAFRTLVTAPEAQEYLPADALPSVLKEVRENDLFEVSVERDTNCAVIGEKIAWRNPALGVMSDVQRKTQNTIQWGERSRILRQSYIDHSLETKRYVPGIIGAQVDTLRNRVIERVRIEVGQAQKNTPVARPVAQGFSDAQNPALESRYATPQERAEARQRSLDIQNEAGWQIWCRREDIIRNAFFDGTAPRGLAHPEKFNPCHEGMRDLVLELIDAQLRLDADDLNDLEIHIERHLKLHPSLPAQFASRITRAGLHIDADTTRQILRRDYVQYRKSA